MASHSIIQSFKSFIPILSPSLHKGSCGRIGVIGGSLEFTGAPFFAAMSALKTGADLVHVFCCRDAAIPIKSYSPELMVHPLLDGPDAAKAIAPWLDRLHALVIGPGLGRNEDVFQTIKELVKYLSGCKNCIPLIFDADSLHFIAQTNGAFIKDYPGKIVLTPNAMEYSRLATNLGIKEESVEEVAACLQVLIVKKGFKDEIVNKDGMKLVCDVAHSPRRCGGQGDVLSGILGTFAAWENMNQNLSAEKFGLGVAAFAACALTRTCSHLAFNKYKRSTVATGLIEHIQNAFCQLFDE